MADEIDKAAAPIFGELGMSGLKVFSGYVNEEFLTQLQGSRGVRVYRQMAENDSVVSAVLTAIDLLIRAAEWNVTPANDTPQAEEASAFVKSLTDDMNQPFEDFVSEAMSMLVYGWSYFEHVLKRRVGPHERDPRRRSKFSDGRIGIRKLAIRSQDSLERWEMQGDGGIAGMWQIPPQGGQIVFLPIEKCLLFRTSMMKNNPEGRALALDTPVPTPDGWTTMGEIAVGDKVYDETGRIRYVVAKSEVWKKRPAFRLTFTDGTSIVADENHEWSATTFNDRNGGKQPRIFTTREMWERENSSKRGSFFCFGEHPTLDAPAASALPVDPYVLGYWLGDGHSGSGAVAVHKEDFPFLAAEAGKGGYPVSFDGDRGAHVSDLRPALRWLGVIGNKHIPSAYLRGSVADRLSLLQGLMDSDGTSPGYDRDAASRWYNSNPDLVAGFVELVRTLGCRPRVRVHTKAGRPCGTINGKQIIQKKDLYEVAFYSSQPVHRLPRKLAGQKVDATFRTRAAYLKSIEPVEPTDTVCIEVDGPSHLFLAGEGMVPTHNSILRQAYRSWYILKTVQNAEAIGIERELAGLPVAYVPAKVMKSDAAPSDKAFFTTIKQIVRDVKFNEQGAVVLPSDMYPDQEGSPSAQPMVRLELLSTNGRRQIDTNNTVVRYQRDIARAALADFIMLGTDGKGSYALSQDKTDLFLRACETYLWRIATVLNRILLPRIWDYNGLSRDLMPEFTPGKIAPVDLEELGIFIERLSRAGAPLFPDESLEDHLRGAAGLPEAEAEVM